MKETRLVLPNKKRLSPRPALGLPRISALPGVTNGSYACQRKEAEIGKTGI